VNNPVRANSTQATAAGVSGTGYSDLLSAAGKFQEIQNGIGVSGMGATGVQGVSDSGVGVSGTGVTGVQGVSVSGVGVLGQSAAATAAAIHGISTAFDAVVGETSSAAHAGVTGRITNATPGPNACALYGDAAGHGGLAGKFDGNVQINGNITGSGNHHCQGTMTVDADIVLSVGASDCAEEFEIQSTAEAEPGTVMVLDDAGCLRPASRSYDKNVAGVISGAGCYRPGIILGRGQGSPTRLPVALVGKVFCKVDARYGPIEVGDLLTTSPTPGHAMSAQDRSQAFGAVIGKALQRLSEGCGLVPILVALQ
jgi:hypothetical protein